MTMPASDEIVSADFLIIGAGIAGASIAYWLSPHGRVVVLEREPQPGYHSTGRSAAMFIESYGPPQARALTRASRAFFENPPEGFTGHPILGPRGSMCIATLEQRDKLEEYWQGLQAMQAVCRRLTPSDACALLPVLRPDRLVGAVIEPDALDLDVHAVHQGYLRGIRRRGGRVVCDAEVAHIAKAGAEWRVRAGTLEYRAPVLVNAAGAWADQVARLADVLPLGLEPRRRSAFIFAPPAGIEVGHWPMVMDVDEDWYMKPDAGMLLGSPANADPTEPQDVQPEEMDIAMAIERIEAMTTLEVRRPARTWAGLRTFVADGDLVGGYDPRAAGFFWVAGQGGYGIQTSAAMGEACAALVRERPIPGFIADFGVSAALLAPRHA